MRAEADGLRVTIRSDVLNFTNHGDGVAPSWPQVSQCCSPSKPAPLCAALAHDKAVEEEKDHRADDAADEASAISRVIPADGLPEVGGNECANDSQDGGEDKSLWLVLAGHNKLCDNAGDEANDDRPDNAHIALQDGPAQTSGPTLRDVDGYVRNNLEVATGTVRLIYVNAVHGSGPARCFHGL